MAHAIERLLHIMASLRDARCGCAWDLQQTFETIAPYAIEEAYEVSDAIHRGDLAALRDELGDLLFQVVFHSRIAEERNVFSFGDVINAICDKMVRRHPHVFGESNIRTAAEQNRAWEEHKSAERGPGASALDGVAAALPALTRAKKVQQRAARIGFDWADAITALEKFGEEQAELAVEIRSGADVARVEDEVGDLLFTCVNVTRKLGLDPEQALRKATSKFERRFRQLEALLVARDQKIETISIDEMERLWQQVKAGEAKEAIR